MITKATQEHFYKRIGELLKDARLNANISQEALSEYLGLSRISILQIEKGKQKIQIHTLIEAIKFLQIPVEPFFIKLVSVTNAEINHQLEQKLSKIVVNDEYAIMKEFINFSVAKREK